jgi:hypothetical protein
MSDALKSVTPPATLNYVFTKSGTLEKGFTNAVQVKVSGSAQAKKVATNCVSETGAKLEAPAMDSGLDNPALICFLDRDIREMERLTKGKAAYFRKRIRLALAESAEVRAVTVDYNGRQVPGKEIRITPYVNDPMKDRFERFTGKYYVFTVAEEIPGGLYRIEAVIPDRGKEGTAADNTPLMEEVMTSPSVSPAPGANKPPAKKKQ